MAPKRSTSKEREKKQHQRTKLSDGEKEDIRQKDADSKRKSREN